MADDNVIRREFQAELTPVGDGRTLDLRIIPYNTPATVSDGGPEYVEEWAPGVFRNKETRLKDVLVNVEHEKGFAATVARCVAFNDTRDGFDGEFRMLSDPMSDKALELVNEGVFSGVSVEAIPIESQRTADGVVRRISAKLKAVALCRNPAFKEARVLAVREAPEEITPEVFEPVTVPDISRSEQVLAAIKYEPLEVSEVVERPWNGSAERFDDEQYARSCLVTGALPVLEPDGALNKIAMRQAAVKLTRPGLPLDVKAQAARKLIRYYRLAGETPPPALFGIASR